MSLFIAMLAFDEAAPRDAAKLGIVAAHFSPGSSSRLFSKRSDGKNLTTDCTDNTDEKMIMTV
jgi:hypothetical protein